MIDRRMHDDLLCAFIVILIRSTLRLSLKLLIDLSHRITAAITLLLSHLIV
jgi:hypothetical protein